MGLRDFYEDVKNPLRYIETGGGMGLDTDQGKSVSFVMDPMDLSGRRAKYTQDEIDRIQREAAAGSVDAQQEMMRMQTEMQQPYYDASQNALSALLTGATGQGDYEFTPTNRYMSDLEQGQGAIDKQLSARGRRNSTYGHEQQGQFVSDLTGQETNRQQNQLLDLVKMRQGATSAMGGAYQQGGQNIGGIYNALGGMANQNQQAFGAQRQDSLNQAGTAIGGLSQYLQGKV